MSKILNKIVNIGFAILSVLCFIYYTKSYYKNTFLFLDKDDLGIWIIFVFITTISLLIGVYNTLRIEQLTKLNIELKAQLNKLSEDSYIQYDSVVNHILNNRDLALDVYNNMVKKSEVNQIE